MTRVGSRAAFAALMMTVALPLTAYAQDVIELQPINVAGEDPAGPVEGYIAKTSSSGTKTGVALTKIDQMVNVVPADQIAAQGAETVAEALRFTPGVFTEYRGTSNLHDEMYVRGFGYVPRFVDGLAFGTNSFGQIDPWLLERVEVVKGPASVLYGQANPGGIVNLATKRPTGDSFRRGRVAVGSDARAELSFDMGGTFADNDTLSWRIAGTAWQADTPEDGLKQRRYAFMPSLTWAPDDSRSLTVSVLSQSDPEAGFRNFREKLGTVDPTAFGYIPAEFLISDPSFQKSERYTNAVSVQYQQDLGASSQLRANFRATDITSEYRTLTWGSLAADEETISRTASGGTDDLFQLTLDVGVETRFSTGAADHTLLVGLDMQQNKRDYAWGFNFSVPSLNWRDPAYGLNPADYPLTDRQSDTDTVARQSGIYVSDRIELGALQLSAGLRLDKFDTEITDNIGNSVSSFDDTALTGHIGALYTFDNGVAPYISYATSFEPVTESPLAGNPAFDPTEGEQIEAGVKWLSQDGRFFAQAAIFDITQTGVLNYNSSLGGYEQTGQIDSQGFEFEGRMELAQGLDVIASYSYLDATVAESIRSDEVGKTPSRLPGHQASIWANYEMDNGFGLGAGVRYIGESQGDGANSFTVPDVTLFDLALSYDFGAGNPSLEGMKAQVNIRNLTDEFYAASCASVYACFVGTGRTVTASLDFAF
ncbi:MAG: hypothetical protein BM562_13750 [Alphaproteobacteria bacterium MedPE-SWcel]|nr:MAG: hypothetical protein BM562_13750 [Alphaproteobacteria bacterium MedPE-SWcel]